MAEKNNTPESARKGATTDGRASAAQSGNLPKQSGLPRIRTYAADMSRAIKTRGETLSTIVSAEKKTSAHVAEAVEEQRARRKTLLVGSGAILLVLLGIAAVAGVFYALNSRDDTADITEGIIFPNQTIAVDAGIGDVREQLSQVRTNADMSLGEIARLVLTQNGTPLSSQEIVTRLGFPSALAREVEDVMVGIHAFDRNQPFVIMSIAAYDRSFNALLTAEKDLGRNLGVFFAPHDSAGGAPELVFEDAIIRNIDVRKSASSWPILYSYPQRTVVVITTNEFTLREIISRLANQRR